MQRRRSRYRSTRATAMRVVAVLLSALAIRAAYSSVRTLDRQAHALGAAIEVVVATRDMPVGHVVRADDLARVTRHRSQVPPDALQLDDALDRVVQQPVVHDAVLQAAHLGDDGPSSAVGDGERAMRVVDVSGLRPPAGSRVDIYASYEDAGALGASGAAELLARDALVLPDRWRARDLTGSTESGTGVLVLIRDDEARSLAFANAFGIITIALAPTAEGPPP